MASVFNQQRHVVIEQDGFELGRWLSEEPWAQGLGLFVYFHRQAMTWNIGRWLNRDAGTFEDVYHIGENIGDFDWKAAWELKRRLRGDNDHPYIREELARREYRDLRERTDESMEKAEKKLYARKRKSRIAVSS